jgi:hypothetical protein
MDQVGPKKELRLNPGLELDRETTADLVDRSGVQEGLDRSLWTPEVTTDTITETEELGAIVIMGGVANWQDRSVYRLALFTHTVPIHALAGPRVMDLPTEQANPNVSRLHRVFGRYPTEAEYMGAIIVPKLTEAIYDILPTSFQTGDGDTIFEQFFQQNEHLVDERLVVARVANAGVIMAIQLRNAARKFKADFDANREEPQVFVVTDTFPVARSEEEDEQPDHYQKASTALRQVVLTAKKLHEAVGGE